jgi:hypothetical protein
MMTTAVSLPEGELIDCQDFVNAIARARCPVPDGAIGMECITGKLVAPDLRKPRPQRDLLQHDRVDADARLSLPTAMERANDQLDQAPGAVERQIWKLTVEHQFPKELTSSDRKRLRKVLPGLPPLRYPMSDDFREMFMQAFRVKACDWLWEPILLTDRYIQLQRQRQEHVFTEQLLVLGNEFSWEHVIIVDQAHIPVSTFNVHLGRGHYFLSRQSAIQYLEQHGFGYGDIVLSKLLKDDPSSSVKRKQPVDKAAVYAFLVKKRNGKENYNQLTCEKFGISPSYVRRIVRGFESKPKTPQSKFPGAVTRK